MALDTEFRVLGPLEVRVAGRTVAVGGPRQRAVLAALLIERGSVVPVDRIVDMVWSGSPPSSATGTLQGYVSLLRRVLCPEPAERDRVIRWQAPGYLLDVPAEAVDADLFASLVDEGVELRRRDPAAAREVLRRALSLWRGEAYADLADQLFTREERTRLHELRAHALEERIAADLDVGEHRRVLAEIPALVGQFPLRERLSALHALALYRSGRQAEALEVFDRVRSQLVEELGIDPGAELRRLHEQVLRQDPAIDWRPPPSTAPAAAVGAATPSTTIPSSSSTAAHRPLFGRESELAQLRQAWADARDGRGGLVLIAGDPGIGKTRLLEVLADEVATQGGAAVWGRCAERGVAPPFWLWLQVLRDLIERLDDEDLSAALGVGAADVARLVPDLKVRLGDIGDSPSDEDSRFRLHDAVIRFLLRVAAGAPLLVAIDDLHWAGPASLELLELLTDELSFAPLLVVATFRDADADRGEALSSSLAVLARGPAVQRLTLGGLDEDAVAALIEAAGGGNPAREVTARIRQRTNGNPFFVSELASLLRSGEASGAAAEGLPPGVRAVLDHRFAALPSPTSRALSVAAVLGREFDVPMIADMLHEPVEEVFEALDVALDARLIEEWLPRYRFRHALVRDAVYARLSATERMRLHAAAGKAGEAAGVPASVLAHHFAVAAPLGYGPAAIDAAERAADHAARVSAGEQATEHLRAALQILANHGPPDPRREVRLLARLATLLAEIRGWTAPEVRASALRVRELAQEVPGAPEVVSTLWLLWGYLVVGGDFDGGFAIADELDRVAEATGDPLATAAALQSRGTTCLHTGRLEDAHTLLFKAMEHADALGRRPFGNSTAEMLAASTRGHGLYVCHLMGHTDHISMLEEGTTRLTQDEQVPAFVRGFGLVMLCTSALLSGHAEAGALAEESVQLNRRLGFTQLLVLSEVVAGRLLAETAPKEGVERIEQALRTAARTGMRMLVAFQLRHLAAAQRLAGCHDAARTSLLEGLAASEATGEVFAVPDLLLQLADLDLDAGDREAAAGWLRQAVESARQQGAHAPRARAEQLLAELDEAASGG